MRTTLRLPKALLERAKAVAREEGITLTALVERGLEQVLRRSPASPAAEREMPICRAGGGYLPGLSVEAPNALLDQLDEWDGRVVPLGSAMASTER
jgi:hypothetical protein